MGSLEAVRFMSLKTLDNLSLTKDDFVLDWFSGTGAGGQHRNKHQNCCRLTHKATGIVVTAQTARTRPENQKAAVRLMAVRLLPWIKKQYGIDDTPDPMKDRAGFGSGEIVRTYHMIDNRVVDHRTGMKFSADSWFSDTRYLTKCLEDALSMGDEKE